MDAHEILPSPHQDEALVRNPEHTEIVSESQAARQTEFKHGPMPGSAAIAGAAVGNAQQYVGTVAQGNFTLHDNANQVMHTAHPMPVIANDLDLIEKEWVRKAKEVVEATIGDPYTQNIEINKVKADYIQKRYNKAVKVKE